MTRRMSTRLQPSGWIRQFLILLVAFAAGVCMTLLWTNQDTWMYSSASKHAVQRRRSLRGATTHVEDPKVLLDSPLQVPYNMHQASNERVYATPEPHGTKMPQFLAQGQHIVLDLYGVDAAVLDDEEGLANVSSALLHGLGMTILSIRSHKLSPQGVSITVTIAESHLTIHTWPEHGTALIDMFTCGATDLLVLVPNVVHAYGGKMKNARWALIPRGHAQLSDLDDFLVSKLHVRKRQLFSKQSKYQDVQIWSYRDSTAATQSVALFLDGQMQSSTVDEHVYHESLVHPAMLAHPSGAKRVAVLGGGEGATVRELLRYKSVNEVVMVDIDGVVVNASQRYLQQLNNCSFQKGVYKNCFDDSRTTLVIDDAFKWFDRQFPHSACKSTSEDNKFDVIILDLLDPELIPDAPFAKKLYSKDMMENLACALKSDGVFVSQFGEMPDAGDPDEMRRLLGKDAVIEDIADLYAWGGTKVYSTYVPSFRGQWSFVLACKTNECSQRFTDNEARVNLAIRQRISPQALPLRYFDGTVMQQYNVIPKSYEELFCYRKDPDVQTFCRWANRVEAAATLPEGDSEQFIEVVRTEVSEVDADGANRSMLVAAREIVQGEYIGIYDAASALRLHRRDFEALEAFATKYDSPEYHNVVNWLKRYGYGCDELDGGNFYVALDSKFTFANHACDRSAIAVDGAIAVEKEDDDSSVAWNPVILRRGREHCAATRALRTIKKGESILENYGTFDWLDNSMGIKKRTQSWCTRTTKNPT
eukprot:m.397420 g.397420  ORF g.397420 m.397420 type:complete len:760 (+) comp21129_c0_seq3:328-2607(+)